jgi:hypothetical protein
MIQGMVPEHSHEELATAAAVEVFHKNIETQTEQRKRVQQLKSSF